MAAALTPFDKREIIIPRYATLPRPLRIVQIGCGGTGSFIASHLSQYLAARAMTFQGANNIEYILVDGDELESKNLIRQKFVAGDVGRNKAEVLAERYSQAFGLSIIAYPTYVTDLKFLNDMNDGDRETLIIGAVDNQAARAFIQGSLNRSPFWVVDVGNEQWTGQAIISNSARETTSFKTAENISYYLNEKYYTYMPFYGYFDQFPETIPRIPIDATPKNLCAQAVAEVPQTINANMLAAQCAMALIMQWISNEVTTSHLFFDGLSGSVRHIPITANTIYNNMTAFRLRKKEIGTALAQANEACQLAKLPSVAEAVRAASFRTA